MDRPAKRQRSTEFEAHAPESLQRSISPPRKRARKPVAIPSPWQLTWIQDLPESENKDAVSLRDLLGDPLISECWEFNFLHDIPFLMNAFDPDTRHLVNVHLVHGFWKHEDKNRIALEVSRGNCRWNQERVVSRSRLGHLLTRIRMQPQNLRMSMSISLLCLRCLGPIIRR